MGLSTVRWASWPKVGSRSTTCWARPIRSRKRLPHSTKQAATRRGRSSSTRRAATMCGIVSVLAGAGGVDEGGLRRALDAIRHRGPDGDGIWLAPDRAVGIGHVRLGLVGLDDGAQPIASE